MVIKYLAGFSGYKPSFLKHDLMAALVVTSISIPESLGFAAIVGLPLETGLYCAFLPPIIFAILTSSKRMVVGADSATAALIASGVGAVAIVGTATYGNAIAWLGILTATILILISVMRLGFVADLLSKPVLVGFFAGVGVQLILSKLPELVGLDSANHHGLSALVYTLNNLSGVNVLAIAVSVLVVGLVLIIGRSRYPGMLIGVFAATIMSVVFGLSEYGVKLVGELPHGLPSVSIPVFDLPLIVSLVPAALAIALVILAQSAAVLRAFAAEHDEKVRINQDLLALSFSNFVSALTHGFAINGSPPRSLAAEFAGGRSQMVNIFMGLIVGAILLFATGIFRYVPAAALASVVFVIGLHLINTRAFRQIYEVRRSEFAIALLALAGVIIFGVIQGILVAVIVSLMERLHRQYRPHDQILLRDGEISEWAQQRLGIDPLHSHHPHDVLIYSFNGSLFFENIRYFSERLEKAISKSANNISYVIIDAGSIDDIDYTAVEGLTRLHRKLSLSDIQLGFAHVPPHLRDLFQKFGITDLIGPSNIYSTLKEALAGYPKGKSNIVEKVKKLELSLDDYVVIGGGVLEIKGIRTTHDADLVVNDKTYKYLRDELAWKEYVHDNGKRILSHHGYHIMRRWMGNTVKDLSQDSFLVDGVKFMNIRKLMKIKSETGLSKDAQDVRLIKNFLKKK